MDRPTREQVDADLSYVGALEHDDDTAREAYMADALRVLAAEVRALRAEQQHVDDGLAERLHDALTRAGVDCDDDAWPDGLCHYVVGAALAARTPQPTEPDVIRAVGALRRAGADVDRWDGRRWVPTVIVAGSSRQGPWVEDETPLPAVPDGEDGTRFSDEAHAIVAHHGGNALSIAHLLVKMGRLSADFERKWEEARKPAAADGKDVPARLDAAADACDTAGLNPYTGECLREASAALRRMPADVRAAVAAALARPTGAE